MEKTINILHVTDLHFNEDMSVLDARSSAKGITDSCVPSSERIDFIAVTGDISFQGQMGGFRNAGEFFIELSEKYAIERSRVLYVPGNHDVEWRDDSSMGFNNYGKFANDWYCCGDKTDIHPVDDTFETAFVVDARSKFGVVFLLINCYLGVHERISDLRKNAGDKIKEMGYIGVKQIESFNSLLSKLKVDNNVPKIALFHHHIFPQRTYGKREEDVIRNNILVDFAVVTNWLVDIGCVCVLHGHRHFPFVGVYKNLKYDFSILKQHRIPLGSSDCVGVDAELIVAGAGLDQGFKNSASQHVRDNNQKMVDSFHIIKINPRPVPFIEVRAEIIPFFRIENCWQKSKEGTIKSNDTLPEFNKSLYLAESFTSSQISIDTGYPLVATCERDLKSVVDEWFWNCYQKAVSNFPVLSGDEFSRSHVEELKRKGYFQGESDVDELPRKPCELILWTLIKCLAEKNRSRSIFSIMPFQLEGIYTFASIFFSERDINKWAEVEFKSSEWMALLNAKHELDPVDKQETNHLELANRTFAKSVGVKFDNILNDTKKVRILEVGFGALRTLSYLVRTLARIADARKIRDGNESSAEFQYMGIDVNSRLVLLAKDRIANPFDSVSRLVDKNSFVPFSGQTEYLFQGSAYDALCNDQRINDYAGTINIVVASYVFHHIANHRRIEKSLLNGTFFKFFPDSDLRSGNTENFIKHVGTNVFLDIQHDEREKFVRDFFKIHTLYNNKNMNGDTAEGMAEHYQNACKIFREMYFPDKQKEVYKKIYHLLAPGGLFCLADPNGFSSSFNRHRVISDWAMAIAHFADWDETVELLDGCGFKVIEIYRQVRKKNLIVENIRVNREDPMDLGENIESLEIEDQHLGYVIISEKPR